MVSIDFEAAVQSFHSPDASPFSPSLIDEVIDALDSLTFDASPFEVDAELSTACAVNVNPLS